MSVSSGSDVTIPIQDSPPPPPSPYANQKSGSKRGMSKTPEPRGDVGVDNDAFQSTENQTNGHKSLNETISPAPKRTQTEIQMTGSSPNQAVNAELINMNVLDTIPQKPQPEFGPYENFDEYFISVNQHKKFLRRGEKLYVTKDKRKTSKCKKYVCWLVGAFILAAIVTVAVLAGVGLIPHKSPTTLSMVETTTTGKSTDTTIKPSSGQTEFTSERQQSTTSISDESTVSPDPILDGTSSSTTQAPAPVADTRVPSAADIQLTLDNGVYNDSLQNSLSSSYVTLASEVELLLKRTMEEDYQLNTAFARVLDFSEGSIVAKVRLGWIDDNKKSEDVQRLVSTLRKLGDYDVRPGTTFYSVFNFCKLSNNGCSNYCTFDYESLDFLCTCPEHLVLAEDKKTCQEIPSPSPAPSENVTSSESPAEIEPSVSIPTEIPPEVSEDTDTVPATDSPAPEETSHPEKTPILSSSTSTTTSHPIPEEVIITNATSSETIDGDDSSSEKQNSTITADEMTVPFPEIPANASESSNVSSDESLTPTTIMPDIDYNVELSPELSNHPVDNTSEKFAQIMATEPTSMVHAPENDTSLVVPEPATPTDDHLHQSSDDVTSTTTTTTALPPIIEEQNNTENPAPVPELSNQNAEIPPETASTTTTTTTDHPPIVEIPATVENHTHISPEIQHDLSPEVETIFQNTSSAEVETNRTSRLIMKSQRSENFEMGNSGSEESLESESVEEGPRREESQEQIAHPTGESITHSKAEHNPTIGAPVLTTVSPVPLSAVSNETASNTMAVYPGFPIFSSETEEREREAIEESGTVAPSNQTAVDNHPESDVEEIEVTPTVLPSRPIIPGSDEYMAFSDANMRVVNENLKKVNVSLEPSSASAETSSYEVVSGDESEISHSNSHSDENNPSPFRVEHREIEEVTTIQPISLINDTAVNDLTENVTEDLVNSENIFQVSEETVPMPAVTESSGSREAEHGAGEGIRDIIVDLVTYTTAPTTTTLGTTTTTTIKPEFHIIHDHHHVELPEQIPIEKPKPQNPESASQEEESHAFNSQEIGITTTTGRSIGGPGHESMGFSTTIPILPHVHSEEEDASATTTTIRPDHPSSNNSSKIHTSVDNENELH